jgi:hypothetical protein
MGSTLVLASCTLPPPPVEDYVLARAAIDAAKAVDAGRYSAGYFHKAEVMYRKAQSLYDDRDYDQAHEAFLLARDYAERAENSARLIRFKNGDVL